MRRWLAAAFQSFCAARAMLAWSLTSARDCASSSAFRKSSCLPRRPARRSSCAFFSHMWKSVRVMPQYRAAVSIGAPAPTTFATSAINSGVSFGGRPLFFAGVPSSFCGCFFILRPALRARGRHSSTHRRSAATRLRRRQESSRRCEGPCTARSRSTTDTRSPRLPALTSSAPSRHLRILVDAFVVGPRLSLGENTSHPGRALGAAAPGLEGDFGAVCATLDAGRLQLDGRGDFDAQ